MRKLHWISMALVVAPFAFAGACGGDDTTGGGAGAAGTSTGSSGSGGSGMAGTSSSGGSSGSGTSSGGSSGSVNTGGSSGSAGAGTGGMAGTAAPDSGGGGSAGAGTGDAAAETAGGDDGSSTKCTVANDPGIGKSCKDLCDGYFKTCKERTATMSTYANQAACVTACKGLTQAQMCCRALHAVTVSTTPGMNDAYYDMHCGHVIGMSPCT
jgi:hypothetical protein